MNYSMSVSEAREMLGENSYEIDGGFITNHFGKYQPNITFVVGKEVELDANGKLISPLGYIKDKEVTDGMNMDFDGDPAFMFGDFWRSKKGGACFRPKDPREAKDLLIRVNWGGAFDSHRGTYPDEARRIEGVKYFHRASSNGGGSGYDYWVVPVGFYRSRSFSDIDGHSKAGSIPKQQETRIREKHALFKEKRSKENDTAYRARLAKEEKSRENRDAIVPRLQEISKAIEEIYASQKFGNYRAPSPVKLGDTYFEFESRRYLYTEESLAEYEKALSHHREYISENEAKAQLIADVKADIEETYPDLSSRFDKVGWEISLKDSPPNYASIQITKESSSFWGGSDKLYEFPFTKEGAEACIKVLEGKEEELQKKIEAEEAARKLKEAQKEAKEMGLPSDVKIWNRSGATNAGQGYVITPDGMDRPCDRIEGDSRRIQRYGEGYEVWDQIMPGELVLEWGHAYTAAPHDFKVIYRPEQITEAQLERVAEIQNRLEEKFFGKAGLTGTRSCPSIGQGWGLFHREETLPKRPEHVFDTENVRVFVSDGPMRITPTLYYSPLDKTEKEAIVVLDMKSREITISFMDTETQKGDAYDVACKLWGRGAEGDSIIARSPHGRNMSPHNLVRAVMKVEETIVPPVTMAQIEEMGELREALDEAVTDAVDEMKGAKTHDRGFGDNPSL